MGPVHITDNQITDNNLADNHLANRYVLPTIKLLTVI